MKKDHPYTQFKKDMECAGFKVEHYRGRNFYDGPSVFVTKSELQDVIRATELNLRWDTLGVSGLVIYLKT